MFGRSRSTRLFTVDGIRVGVDVSWFIVLFLLIYLLATPFRETLGASELTGYLTTVVAVLALFASILVHELGHAVAAKRRGVGVTRIDLNLLGGLTEMSREPASPGEDFTIAVAGPLATVAVILVCGGLDLALVGGHRLRDAIVLDPSLRITPTLLVLSWLIPMNVLLLGFNLLPAFPLDGGKIARSVVWALTGDRRRGTVVSARLGQLLALALLALGVYLLAGAASYSGLYSLALAWVVFSLARSALARAALDARVDGVTVADIMDGEPATIPATMTVEEALLQRFRRYGWSWFPVIDEDGRFLGVAQEATAQAALAAGDGAVSAAALAQDGPDRWQVSAGSPIVDLFGAEPLRALGAAMAVDETGRLCGVVTVQQISRALATSAPAG